MAHVATAARKWTIVIAGQIMLVWPIMRRRTDLSEGAIHRLLPDNGERCQTITHNLQTHL
ncbi:hypothetical protein [Bradyrhizobium sp. CCBAU 51627]|uniref:hypothetical protein n=1 Tax=Bradyrhizobium sp. CCBAU 51627 TaxID=1325088 RepID=UPI00230538C7|nr:hypothetical protein [Bradyrhizobium sp. CCBAU 51627]MDA9431722.1 hypothetical protein [Bradyrhizobium sp. CCBAU 51627]